MPITTSACPACHKPLVYRIWLRESPITFIDVYACGSVYRWGHGAKLLQACLTTEGALTEPFELPKPA